LLTLTAWLRAALLCATFVATGVAYAKSATLLILGDSLSAEYGLVRDTGWVHLLAERMANEAPQYSVVNASISGETTSGGRTRLPELLRRHRPSIVVVQLGANDGLRGLSLASMRENLTAMVRAARAAGARVLLIGMRMPPNYGREFSQRFAAVFVDVAREEKVPLTPFLLEGFAEDLDYFQGDRIHPNQKAQARMLANTWPQLNALLRPVAARPRK
jgi:acyl-CoA thioesterase-1